MSQEIGAEAADLGISVGLEIINRYETNILNTAAQVPAGSLSGTRPRGPRGSHSGACMPADPGACGYQQLGLTQARSS